MWSCRGSRAAPREWGARFYTRAPLSWFSVVSAICPTRPAFALFGVPAARHHVSREVRDRRRERPRQRISQTTDQLRHEHGRRAQQTRVRIVAELEEWSGEYRCIRTAQ